MNNNAIDFLNRIFHSIKWEKGGGYYKIRKLFMVRKLTQCRRSGQRWILKSDVNSGHPSLMGSLRLAKTGLLLLQEI